MTTVTARPNRRADDLAIRQDVVDAVIEYGVFQRRYPDDWLHAETPTDRALGSIMRLLDELRDAAFDRGYACGCPAAAISRAIDEGN